MNQSVVHGHVRPAKVRTAVLRNGNVTRFYGLLLDILRSRNYLTVKARDACYVLGYCDASTLTGLGHLLSILVRLGYAEKVNSGQPTRYVLKPRSLWGRVREVCDLRSCGECPLLIPCPLREIVQVLGAEGAQLSQL